MLEYNYKTVHNIIGESNNDLIKEWRKKWGYFPSFPNVKLIIALSAQMYEKQACYSNLAFLPDQFKRHISYALKYKNHLTFDTNNLRFIRKMLESVDEKHCLVFQKERGLLKAVGIASLEYVTAHLIPIIKVRGHMLWQAEIRGRPLFEYRNGNFGFVVPNYNIEGVHAIMGRQGALCGNINLSPEKSYATEHAVVISNYAGTDIMWTYYSLTASNLNQYATATAQPGLSVANILRVLYPLPPLTEQHRIVAKIEELFNQINKIYE